MTTEQKTLFLEEIKKVPNRDVLRVATRAEIRRIAEEIDFEAIERIYAESPSLGLVKSDIPEDMLFEANFIFNLSLEFETELHTGGYWEVYYVWNLEDLDTYKMVENYAIHIGDINSSIYDAYSFSLDTVLQYAKSSRL